MELLDLIIDLVLTASTLVIIILNWRTEAKLSRMTLDEEGIEKKLNEEEKAKVINVRRRLFYQGAALVLLLIYSLVSGIMEDENLVLDVILLIIFSIQTVIYKKELKKEEQ